MENQHRQIKGYRELTEHEIAILNMIKTKGIEVGGLIDWITDNADADPRWIEIARTHLQQGFMALTRAVAKPDFF